MPKPGYTTIVVKASVRSRLQELARLRGYKTVNQLLEDLIAHGLTPAYTPPTPTRSETADIPSQKRSPFQANFQREVENP